MSTTGGELKDNENEAENVTEEGPGDGASEGATLVSSNDSVETVVNATNDVQTENENNQGAIPKRQIKLTVPAQDIYNQEVLQYTSKLNKMRNSIDAFIESYSKEQMSASDIKLLSDNVSKELQNYQLLSEKFIGYLKRKNTKDSAEEESAHLLIYSSTLHKTQSFISEVYQQLLESASRSIKSNSSKSSKSSSILMNKKAKMEAAKKRLEYAEKEAKLEQEKIKLEEDELKAKAEMLSKKSKTKLKLEMLNTEKEAAIAEAEFNAVKDELEYDERKSIPLPNENTNERVQRYLEEQRKVRNLEQKTTPDKHQIEHSTQPNQETKLDPRATEFLPRSVHFTRPSQSYDDYEQRDFSGTSQENEQSFNMASDFTRFLLKKELLMNRFSLFNDKPEYYPSWKEGFKVIVREIMANESEEIDLLMKWSGPQSRNHVQSIKAANSGNPNRALRLIWERLDERFGSPELIDNALKRKLQSFPRITNRDFSKLYELSDILSEIVSLKQNPRYGTLFSYFDSSIGVAPIITKLPYQLQERWTGIAVTYNTAHDTVYPPLNVFADFIREQSKIKNNPSFIYESSVHASAQRDKHVNAKPRPPDIRVHKVESNEVVRDDSQLNDICDPSKRCPIHGSRHTLNECKAFKSKPIYERRRFLKQNKICFKCCLSSNHIYRDCQNSIKCSECGKSDHPTALHIKARSPHPNDQELQKNGGEYSSDNKRPGQKYDQGPINSKCTQICHGKFGGKSCAKIVLVKGYMSEFPERKLKFYAILDDQSNQTLGKSELFNFFGSTTVSDYLLSTCSGKSELSGRKLNGLVLESLDSKIQLHAPDIIMIIECDLIPDSRDEIPTPEIAYHYPHLNDIAESILPLDDDSQILLLIGRDLVSAHHVLDQRVGPQNAPYAQKQPLGWTIIGETCLGKVHRPDEARVKKVHLLTSYRTSIFQPCENEISVEEIQPHEVFKNEVDKIGMDVFKRTADDNKIGLSKDDREFIKLMDDNFKKDGNGNWSAPLPFRSGRKRLPNNEVHAYNRAKSLHAMLTKNPQKREHFFDFMKGIMEKGHAEIAPDISKDEEQWFLPIFGVYHPKKPGKLRAVFDSSSQFEGISLNNVLLVGPDVTNSLLGVLLRFRREKVAAMGDIEQMFYSFKVDEQHRNFLKFFWYTDNDFSKPLIAYRMCVHVFGNSPSPAIATYGLRKTANDGKQAYGSDMVEFVTRDFYVDDGLTSQPTAEEAIDLIQRTQCALKTEGNLRLHKISSNDETVMKAFDTEDLAKELKNLDFDSDDLPSQRSLGMNWNLHSDCFAFQIATDLKPFTRRGLLSTINSLYDPLGFLAPVTIQGKLILRSAMTANIPWDEPLPQEYLTNWENWRSSLQDLETLQIPRMFLPISFRANHKTVHIYSDASEKAVAAVGYLQLGSEANFGFIMGKAKVAPNHGHTIPRLELCGAVLATELGQIISDNLNIPLSDIRYHTDSRVVLGYIHNTSRRFYTYVSNRVAKIHQISDPSQWSYVHTERNPADLATRSIAAEKLQDSIWLSGPPFNRNVDDQEKELNFPLLEPDKDKEIRIETKVSNFKTNVLSHGLGSVRFERFSNWASLVRAIALLKNVIRSRISKKEDYQKCTFKEAELTVIRNIQLEEFQDEFVNLENRKSLHKTSRLYQLNPFIDENKIMRVGGRLSNANVSSDERNPIIIPGKCWIATLLVRYIHAKVEHQGRHFTAGAVKSKGYWIIGGKSLISYVIHRCVTCRKLRKPSEQQQMADLPSDRVKPSPPFTSVGIDTFGPWSVVTRRTRGGAANSKRWAIIFTCMTTRGVHLEVVEEMSTSSFINAFKRLIAIRGDVKLIRSDRGTNFVGATDQLRINAINVEDGPVKKFMFDNDIVWKFNSPHSSHMGGSWERMIRTTRSILNAMIAKLPGKELTHEVLVTLMAEVTAIINSRPLSCTTDNEVTFPLTPSLLITQKPSVLIPSNVSFECKDMYRSQWKQVQYLADIFWKRWQKEYLQTLQTRRKWVDKQPNVSEGDVVLLKDNQEQRLNWPMAIVTKTFPSDDNLVRKVQLKLIRTGDKGEIKISHFVRPISELVVLVRKD